MARIAIIVLAGTATDADRSRVRNAFALARQARSTGDDVTVLFDGAGTAWIPLLERGDHELTSLYDDVEDVGGARAPSAPAPSASTTRSRPAASPCSARSRTATRACGR